MRSLDKLYIRAAKNKKDITDILCHPEIYERISNDDSPPINEFDPPTDLEYIGGFVNNDIIGLAVYTYDEKIKFHFQVLPEYRQKYARQFVRMALEIGKAKSASIYAEIPDCYPEVIRFAKDAGFLMVGVAPKSRKKNGKCCDVKILRFEDGNS